MDTHSGWRQLARWLGWGIVAVAVVSAAWNIGDIVLRGGQSTPFRVLSDVGYGLFPLACGVLAAFIIARQPRNAIGWLMLGPVVGGVFDATSRALVRQVSIPPADPSPLFLFAVWSDGVSWVLFLFPLLVVLLIFPTGRPPSRRWNWVVALAVGMLALFLVLTVFSDSLSPISLTNSPTPWRVANPIGFIPVDAASSAYFLTPWLIGLIVLSVSCVASLLLRYRRSSLVEKTQIKWLLYASGVFLFVYVVFLVTRSLNYFVSTPVSELWSLAFGATALLIPIAIGFAILRYRLWDIDVIIRRTLVYGALTGMLALLFLGGITVLQAVLGPAIGSSQLVTVVTTLVIAALALPLRNRIQAVIDRRFYRKKYDAQRAVEQFAAQLQTQGETDVNGLANEVKGVIQETLQPASVKVWLVATDYAHRT